MEDLRAEAAAPNPGGYASMAAASVRSDDPLSCLLRERKGSKTTMAAAAPKDNVGPGFELEVQAALGGNRDAASRALSAPAPTAATRAATMAASSEEALPGGHWKCQLCGSPTIPYVGRVARSLHIGKGARHHCRKCGRTVCGGCSFMVLDVRTCKDCYSKTRVLQVSGTVREKFIFFVRHAESVWNVAMAAGPAGIVKEIWDRDHPLSDVGQTQTSALRQKIMDGIPESEVGSANVREFYDVFLARRELIHCSPLLRALQTAHLVFPRVDGWGEIKLLRNAREQYTYFTERDCLGAAVGHELIDRAMKVDPQLHDLQGRADVAECMRQWWSEQPESMKDLEGRHKALWNRMLSEDPHTSCTLVAHSNLIRSLLLRFGAGITSVAEFIGEAQQDARTTLQRAMTTKLQNCGVLGVRCESLGFARRLHSP